MPKSKKIVKKRVATKKVATKKHTTHKRKRAAKKPSNNMLIAASFIAILIIFAWLALAATLNKLNDDTSKDARLDALILKAGDTAKSGTAQEALNAYEAALNAAKESGNKAVQATADANASTYQAILDGEKYNQQLNDESQEGGVAAESE